MNNTQIIVGFSSVIVTLLLAILTVVAKAAGAWGRLTERLASITQDMSDFKQMIADVVQSSIRTNEKLEGRIEFLERSRK